MTGPLRVLHVDGDAAFLETVAGHLEAADDRLTVGTATTASRALERVEREVVDCLLTEVSPPESAHLEVVEELAHAEPELPVIVVDDGLEDGTAAEALATGAAEFMPKSTAPGALRVLANRVTTVAAATGDHHEDTRTGGNRHELAESAPAGVWLVQEGEITYANPACASLFGLERDELVGHRVAELIAPADASTLEAHLGTLLDGDAHERTDTVTGLGRWGERRKLELRGRRITTDEGPAVVGAVTDVTAAHEQERRLRTIFEGLDDPLAEVALDGGHAVVQRVNGAFEEVFDVDAGDVVGGRLADNVVPDETTLESAIDAYLRLERATAVTEEVTRETATGERSFRLQGLPFRAFGDPHAYVVYSPVGEGSQRERDLTALQAVARELMAAEDRTAIADIAVDAAERLLDTAVACLYVRDEPGGPLVPLAATDDARELFGELPAVGEGEAAAWYVLQMGEPLVTDDVRSLETVYDRETAVRSEMLLPVGDHGVFIASATEEGAFDERDEALGRTLASTLNAALNRADKERQLREREAELVRENQRLEEFAGIVSHDLRNPLAVVKGNASLLRKEGNVKYLDRIENAAGRMDALIDDLLSLARQGTMVESPEYVELEAVVTRAWTTTDTRGATLDADLDVAVEADPGRLRQLFENLFSNAIEHGARSQRTDPGEDVAEHAGGGITVRVGAVEAGSDERPGGEYGRHVDGFYVADDGEGLPDDRTDLFEPGTTTNDDGTGFGLAIVKRIAEAHGWSVEATESEAGGARFEFTGVDGV